MSRSSFFRLKNVVNFTHIHILIDVPSPKLNQEDICDLKFQHLTIYRTKYESGTVILPFQLPP